MENMQDHNAALQRALDYCVINTPRFRSDIENKDIIVYIGLTRSGKTTLVNCVTGASLRAERYHHTFKITNDDSTIRRGSVSTTSLPHLHFDNHHNQIVVDTPGLYDNRNQSHELINAMFLSQIPYAKSCKFVFVSDINTIMCDNIDNFVKPLTQLIEFIRTDISKSISFVFTKVDAYQTRQHILETFDRQIVTQSKFIVNEGVRDLLRSVVQTRPDCIAFFCLPKHEGVIENKSLLDGYHEAVCASEPLRMHGVVTNLCISEKTHLVILNAFGTFLERLDFDDVVPFCARINMYSQAQYLFASFDDELVEIHRELQVYSNMLQETGLLRLQTIQQVVDSVCQLCGNVRTNAFFNSVLFYISLGNMPNMDSRLVRKYSGWIRRLTDQIERLVNDITDEQDRRVHMNFRFNLNVNVGGIISGVAGACGMRAVVAEASAFVPKAAPVIVAVAAAAAGAAIATAVQFTRERNRRLDIRKQQGRSVEAEN